MLTIGFYGAIADKIKCDQLIEPRAISSYSRLFLDHLERIQLTWSKGLIEFRQLG
jgi:hypothetical protein